MILNQKNKRLCTTNLCLAAAVILSGNNFNKIKQFCNLLGIKTISKLTINICIFVQQSRNFMKNIRLVLKLLLLPFMTLTEKILSTLKGKVVILSGDGRCNSPGKTVKYCTYSMMKNDDSLYITCGYL